MLEMQAVRIIVGIALPFCWVLHSWMSSRVTSKRYVIGGTGCTWPQISGSIFVRFGLNIFTYWLQYWPYYGSNWVWWLMRILFGHWGWKITHQTDWLWPGNLLSWRRELEGCVWKLRKVSGGDVLKIVFWDRHVQHPSVILFNSFFDVRLAPVTENL